LEDKGLKYKIYYTSSEWFLEWIKWYDRLEAEEQKKNEEKEAREKAEWDSAISLMKQYFTQKDSIDPGEFIVEMIRLWFQSGASDVHFQPEWKNITLRLRLDGILQDIVKFDVTDFWKYLQKLKFMSWVKMNVDYIPQDGRFSFDATNHQWIKKKVDARVNFMPWMYSESTVIRFLDSEKWIATFDEIWFTDKNYDILKKYISKTTWMIIITWPTWSWKTTTLYSILNNLNTWTNKIITLEDPIEYEMPGIQQSQINYSKNYDYETGLKAILRHDPDIILVWETRSKETADIAVNAALTWHLVFTTLHTNSAIATIPRLLSMWVESYLLAPAIQLVIGQRLVRRICPNCSSKRPANYSEQTEIEQAIKRLNDAWITDLPAFDGTILEAQGCSQCNETWYQWRIAILEMLEITEDMRNLIIDRDNEATILTKARENWFTTLNEDGIIKVLKWETTLSEIHRVVE
jgi:type IV pilus assembly protein PilB